MKRTAIKRKPAKRRAKGTACIAGKRCIGVYDYAGHRYCAKHAADRMMADAVKTEEGQCRRCGSTVALQWAHVWSRRYGAIRWNRQNSMALCAACHYYMTGRPAEWETFCRSIGVEWDELRVRALTAAPMDPLAVISELAA